METNTEEKAITDGLSMRQLNALQCLNLLQMFAMQRKTINYETLAIMLGLPSKGNALAQAISPVLYDVFNFCWINHLPTLTVLVVRKSGRDKGLPGPGFWKVYFENVGNPDTSFEYHVTITEELTAECFKIYAELGA